jgi:F420-0:gamma-glutamyl ligase
MWSLSLQFGIMIAFVAIVAITIISIALGKIASLNNLKLSYENNILDMIKAIKKKDDQFFMMRDKIDDIMKEIKKKDDQFIMMRDKIDDIMDR